MTPTMAYQHIGIGPEQERLSGAGFPTVGQLLAKVPALSSEISDQPAAMGSGLTRGQRFAQLRSHLVALPGNTAARDGELAREFTMRLVIELHAVGALDG